MPWWSWILIWLALVVMLLGMLTLCALTLFRKLLAIATVLQRLANLTELLSGVESQLGHARSEIAILVGRAELQRRRDMVREASRVRREQRQAAQLAKARALTAVDASKRSWFVTPHDPKAG